MKINLKISQMVLTVLFLASLTNLPLFAQDGHTPEVLGIITNITDGYGTIVVSYEDQDEADTIQSLRLQIGTSENSHIFEIHLNLDDRSAMIRSDNGDWVISDPNEAIAGNDHFLVNINRLAFNHNGNHGWIVIPVRFDEKAILPEGQRELFKVSARVRDVDDNICEAHQGTVFSLDNEAADIAGDYDDDDAGDLLCTNPFGSLYKWIGFSAHTLEHHIVINYCHDYKDIVYRVSIGDEGGDDAFVYNPQTHEIIQKKYQLAHYDVAWLGASTTKVLGVNRFVVNFLLHRTKSLESVAYPVITVHQDDYAGGKYVKRSTRIATIESVTFWIPTWWLPSVLSF